MRSLPSNSRRAASSAAALTLLLLTRAALADPAPTDAQCLKCHTDAQLKRNNGTPLVPVAATLDASVHGTHARDKVSCIACHADLATTTRFPHAVKLAPATCIGSCHQDMGQKHRFHSKMMSDPTTIACQDCHGGHDTVGVHTPAFKFAPARQAEQCGACHELMRDEYRGSQHGQTAATGRKEAPDCLACHRLPVVTGTTGISALVLKRNQVEVCQACHLDTPAVRSQFVTAGFVGAYEKSVHGRALAAGKDGAPSCASCHGSHDIQKAAAPAARINPRNLMETCGECHGDIAKQYAESVHGVAFARGKHDAPTCTRCHGEHNILGHNEPGSPVAAANVAEKVCSPCHASLELSEKYGLASDRFKTFEDSFHGLAVRGGSMRVANCASCHGSHDIKPSSDPRSRVAKKNLVATCGRCHPGANERFVTGSVHIGISRKHPLLYWIATFYIYFIALIIGGMLLHNGLDFARKTRHLLALRRGERSEPPAGRRMYLRMTVTERWMHALLALSFIALVITGFMLRYPRAWWVTWIWDLSTRAFTLRSLLHRIAAVVMLFTTTWHLFYVLVTRRGRAFLRDMRPRWQDARELGYALRYDLGWSRERPRFGRFSYVEKAEYWALVWGTALMSITGIILWADNTSLNLLTKLGYDVARLLHFYEAWLAALAIAVWHFYAVMFNPTVYPMNWAWLSGHLSEREMAEEHPRELDTYLQDPPTPAPPPAPAPAPTPTPDDPPPQ